MRQTSQSRRRVIELVAFGIGTAVVLFVLWLDIRTSFWQELVIVGGIVAGFVTFIFTVLVIDRVLARTNAKRWAPVTRLAFTELLHGFADEERSEMSRGHIVARHLAFDPDTVRLNDELHRLRHTVVSERTKLATTLSAWIMFLASSDVHEELLLHIAEATENLDRVRDVSLEVEADPTLARIAELEQLVAHRNSQFDELIATISRTLAELSTNPPATAR